MTKIFNFALNIKEGGREGGTCKVLRPCHPQKIWNVHLYLAPHFDVGRLGRIWLKANIEKTIVCKSRIFEIKVFVFDNRQISTRRMFENHRFLNIQLFVFDCRRISKSRIYKSWRKNIRDILRDIRVLDLAKMAVCFEKKFLFDPERKF